MLQAGLEPGTVVSRYRVEELRVYGASVGGQVLLIFAAPTAICDDWKPTFVDVLGSVHASS
jgi:hypothetical protein